MPPIDRLGSAVADGFHGVLALYTSETERRVIPPSILFKESPMPQNTYPRDVVAEPTSSGAPRRRFLGGVAAGVAALVVGRAASAGAELNRITATPPADEKWLAKIKGTHRQVVDCTSHNDGFGVAFALNFIDTTKDALSAPESEFTSVVGFRHFSMPLALNDAMWKKYKIGEMLNVTDPATKAPAVRNIFRDNILGRPGLTYEQVIATRPVILYACNVALTVLSGMAAPNAATTPDAAKAEWTANILPGVVIVPSGVYALNRAQQSHCTYCHGG
jgi:hypothetical protein